MPVSVPWVGCEATAKDSVLPSTSEPERVNESGVPSEVVREFELATGTSLTELMVNRNELLEFERQNQTILPPGGGVRFRFDF